ncbi:MAG: T9SS type A sorting domain-containing protein, partial [bacterium]
NPFNPTTAFSIQLSAFSRVNLGVYNIHGRLVATLVDGYRNAGSHEVIFDAAGLASGVYIYRMEAGELQASGKMVLLK